MRTTTFQDVLNATAEFAMRTRDQIPEQEYVSIQGFLAAEFLEMWNLRAWPDLIPPLLNVQAANRQFSKEQPNNIWIGEVLGVYAENPQECNRHARPIGFYEGDGIVYLDTSRECVWVEYMLPYPSQTWPDLTTLASADFLAALCPLRFRNTLAHKAASHLLGSDGQSAGQAAQLKLAEMCLINEINRLPTEPPWRRTVRLSFAPRGHRRW